MPNWLEGEEHKKALVLQGERDAHENLKTFYDLCNRVNGVRPNALSIHRLGVEGTRRFIIRAIEDDGDGGRIGMSGRRGIRISCLNQDEALIDVVIIEHTHQVDRVCGDLSGDSEKVAMRKTCAIQSLSEWREDQILHTIEWMMMESADIKDHIPGVETMTEKVAGPTPAPNIPVNPPMPGPNVKEYRSAAGPGKRITLVINIYQKEIKELEEKKTKLEKSDGKTEKIDDMIRQKKGKIVKLEEELRTARERDFKNRTAEKPRV